MGWLGGVSRYYCIHPIVVMLRWCLFVSPKFARLEC